MEFLQRLPQRTFNLMGFLICSGLLAFAYYLQFQDGLDPCPLCIFQRVAFMVLAVLFLTAATHNPGRIGSRVYGSLMLISGLAGLVIAGRHVWLQNLPSELVPDCGPGLDYMLEVFPLTETLKMVFEGSGECAEVSWTLLGLSMPAWALLCFLGLGGLGFLRNSFGR